MLDLYGERMYVIEFVLSEYIADTQDDFYKAYVTDALQVLTKNTGRAVGEGLSLTKRWYDVVTGAAKVDKRTGSEIAADIVKRAGLSFGGSQE